jgi:hypothetical protein
MKQLAVITGVAGFLLLALTTCNKASNQRSSNSLGGTESETRSTNSKWEYKVFSFQLEAAGRFNNAPLGALQFKISPDAFTTEIQRITDEGWEYQGLLHTTSGLENNLSYVAFRRPR